MTKDLDIVKTINEKELPSDWKLATISDLISSGGIFVDGDWIESKDQDPNGDIRLIQLADIGDGEYKNRSSRFLTYKKAIELGCTFLKKGDVLVARMPGPLGRACIFPGDLKKAVTAVDIAIIRPDNSEFNSHCLMYFINAPAFRSAVASMQSGSTRKRISRSNLSRILLPTPPRPQQDSIVAEIEKQFSRLDEAVAGLKRIQTNLKRYKASVLKAAVEGKLTEEWRKEHPDVEPASELLKRILAERRKKWEEDYVKKYVAAHGHTPKDDSWKKKYKEPAPSDTTNLPALPKGWVWATFQQLAKNEPNAIKAGPFGSSLKKSSYVSKGFKIYGQEQVLRDDPYFGDYYIDRLLYEKLKSCAVQPGDTLISLVGTIGRVLILPKDIEPGIINPRLVKLSLDNHIINAKFIKAYIQSPYVKHLFSLSSHGGTMDILNLTILKEIPIPLPPLDEQNIIIEELERLFSVEQEIDLIIDANLKRAERLRQSVLKKAFSGGLVKHDELTSQEEESKAK